MIRSDQPIVPPPAVLALTAPHNAGPSPFCAALLAARRADEIERKGTDGH